MARVSEGKIINHQEKFDKHFSDYVKIIDDLQTKFTASENLDFANLVNFKSNKSIPKHKWFEYKQGYAGELVQSIIENEKPDKSKLILDPFCGVGTTNLVAQTLGYKSVGFDINPVAYLASKVKTSFYTTDEIKEIDYFIANFSTSEKAVFEDKVKVIESSFLPETLDKLLIIKGYIDKIKQSKIKDFFLLAYLAINETCSIRIKDGNGIKLKINKKQIENIYNLFLNHCKSMVLDLKTSNYSTETKFFNTSLIGNDYDNLENESVGLCIFSPPYANCFDYCEVYKLEFWFGGFVKKYEDFKNYRDIAFRSHVNSQFDHTIKDYIWEVDVIANLISSFNIWNKNIPDMLRGYFDDTYKLLEKIKPLLTPNAKIFIVVANSGYKGVLVPTDLLIALIAEKLGYQINNIIVARKIRASSQQMTELHNYDNLMRESIIELQKI